MGLPTFDTDRTLCFGGSFNPIHHGHLITARAAAEAAGFSKVLLIPSAQPPHKPNSDDLALANHRLAMCQLAVADDPLFTVTDLELSRFGASYTIDTIRQLKRQGWTAVHWLIGADMLQILPKWRSPLDLLAEATFHIMARPGWTMDWATMPESYRSLRSQVVEVPQLQISATDLRRRIRSNLPISYFMPTPVIDYINANNLYRP